MPRVIYCEIVMAYGILIKDVDFNANRIVLI